MSDLQVLENVLVPQCLLANAAGFGGQVSGDCLVGDLLVRGGRVAKMVATQQKVPPAKLVIPALSECHVHLDKCLTFSRIGNKGGDLRAAIEAQAQDRSRWTAEDLRARAMAGLDRLQSAGCGQVRTHVDWTHGAEARTPPLSWHVLQELAAERKAEVDLQCAPLTGIEDLADLETAEAIARICAGTSGVIGAFVFGQPQLQRGLTNAFEVADRYGLALDFHVDEGLDPSLDGLEAIADTALALGFEGPVLCGHACSLVTRPPADIARIANKLARAGICVVVLPTTNAYLQSRGPQTPTQRGLAPIRSLQDAGVAVAIGTDNVEDAFFPLGHFDPRRALELAVSAAHLDPPFADHLPMITIVAAKAMGLKPTFVDQADARDLKVCDAASTAAFLTDHSAPNALKPLLKRLAS